MAERALFPHGGEQQQQLALYVPHDESMGSGTNGEGSNGDGNPLVQFPNDRVGPTEAVPNQRFFIHAPQFHWHVVQTPTVDDGARRVIERIAHDAFNFGTQTEAHQELLLLRIQDLEAELQRLDAKWNQTKALLHKTESELALQKRKAALDLTDQEERLTRLFKEQLQALVVAMNDDIEKALNARGQSLLATMHARQDAMVAEMQKANKQTRETDRLQVQAEIAESAATSLSALETSLDTTMQTMTAIDQRVTDQLDILTKQVDGLLEVTTAWFEGTGTGKMSPAEGSGEPQEFPGSESTPRPIPSAFPIPSGISGLRDSVASMPSAKKCEPVFTKSRTMTVPVVTGQQGGGGPPPSPPSQDGSQDGAGGGPPSLPMNWWQVPQQPGRAVGGGVKVKVDPPEKFGGQGKPYATQWLVELERWLRLAQIPESVRVDATATRLKDAALTWINAEIRDASIQGRTPWATWSEFKTAFVQRFQPLTTEEVARNQLEKLTQTRGATAYCNRFMELRNDIGTMNDQEAYHAFLRGLKPEIRTMVATLAPKYDVSRAMELAQTMSAYAPQPPKKTTWEPTKPGKPKKELHAIESGGNNKAGNTGGGGSQAELMAVEAKKLKDLRRKGHEQARRNKELAERGKKLPCNYCGKQGHFVKECPDIKALKAKAHQNQGNA